jgi:hypothetical protein
LIFAGTQLFGCFFYFINSDKNKPKQDSKYNNRTNVRNEKPQTFEAQKIAAY